MFGSVLWRSCSADHSLIVLMVFDMIRLAAIVFWWGGRYSGLSDAYIDCVATKATHAERDRSAGMNGHKITNRRAESRSGPMRPESFNFLIVSSIWLM